MLEVLEFDYIDNGLIGDIYKQVIGHFYNQTFVFNKETLELVDTFIDPEYRIELQNITNDKNGTHLNYYENGERVTVKLEDTLVNYMSMIDSNLQANEDTVYTFNNKEENEKFLKLFEIDENYDNDSISLRAFIVNIPPAVSNYTQDVPEEVYFEYKSEFDNKLETLFRTGAYLHTQNNPL